MDITAYNNTGLAFGAESGGFGKLTKRGSVGLNETYDAGTEYK